MVKSPCEKICVLDDNDICIGCKRTKEDIRKWSSYTDEEKTKCVERANERRINEDLDRYV